MGEKFVPTMPVVGLAIALGGPLLLVLLVRCLALDAVSLASRLTLWALAGIVLAIAVHDGGSWPSMMGIGPFGWTDFLTTVVAIVVMLVGAIVLQLCVAKLGFNRASGSGLQKKIYALSARYRVFMIFTAAVTEEILYRGYAIGIGQSVFGSLSVAFAVSLIVFVAAHFTHGAKALVTIFWVSLVMSLLFVYTGNLITCMLAHFAVDAFGVLFAPWAMARQQARAELATGNG
ncbi:CPBP family intramembrane glutamic endopeptidase [Dyella sp. A6]|uniref:CPBP family intramembrane glutamic endopeptidase n=1 Tax=Dyella aluminiiresistens TaxID=3069105 RepID=UPI002E76BA8F|nr:CPBP family intramembrane glutamic endopeptidase [Dyella sp. A6]